MRAKVTKVERQKSYDGGYCWLVTFFLEIGCSGRTYIYESNGNFRRWMQFLGPWQKALEAGHEVLIDKLVWKDEKKRLINADSFFEIVKEKKEAA